MNNIIRLFIMLPVLLLAMNLAAFGKKEEKSTAAPETEKLVRVSGRIRLVGNEPFTELVITGADAEWYIDQEDVPKLKNLQHSTVTVEGLETVKKLTFANGRSAGVRRTLRDIRIISVR